MELMEIILLAVGGIIFILSFFIPDRQGGAMSGALAEKEVRDLLGREMELQRGNIEDMAQEAAADAMDKTERALERLSNEKIMAVSEYSDTVLSEIHKNHEEAMFLYDMLNNKQVSIKNTVSEANRAVKEAEEIAASLQELMAAAAGGVRAQEAVLPMDEEMEKEPEIMAELLSDGDGGSGLPEEDRQGYNNNERILRLYRQGKPAVAIAKELGLGVGEVKLVIGLFEKR